MTNTEVFKALTGDAGKLKDLAGNTITVKEVETVETDGYPTDYRCRHGRGYTQGDRLLWDLIDNRMVRFQNNQIPALFTTLQKNA